MKRMYLLIMFTFMISNHERKQLHFSKRLMSSDTRSRKIYEGKVELDSKVRLR